jgi:hypothetical protein
MRIFILNEGANLVQPVVAVGGPQVQTRPGRVDVAGQQRGDIGKSHGRGVIGVVDDVELDVVEVEPRCHRVAALDPIQIRREAISIE